MPRIDAISNQKSGQPGGCATVFLVGFLSIFVVAGTGIGVFLSIIPLFRAWRAQGWTAKSCEVVSSRVVHNDESSRPEIVYRYFVDDQAYTADRYDFLPGSNSDSKTPAACPTTCRGAIPKRTS